jgi:hypothetical protein
MCVRDGSLLFFWNAKCSAFFPAFSFSSIFHLSLVLCRARGMLLFEFEVPVYYPFKKGKQKISEMIYACWRRVCAHEVNIALFSLALSWNEICSCRFFSSSWLRVRRAAAGRRAHAESIHRACVCWQEGSATPKIWTANFFFWFWSSNLWRGRLSRLSSYFLKA